MAISNLFKQVFEAIPAPCIVLLPDTPVFTIIAVNDAYLAVANLNSEHLVQQSFTQVYSNQIFEKVSIEYGSLLDSLSRVLETKKVDILNFGTLNQSSIVWEVKNIPLLDEHGNVSAILHSLRGINNLDLVQDGNNTEKFFATNNEWKTQLKQAEQIAKFGIWEYNIQKNSLYWSDGVYAIVGYNKENYELNFDSAMAVIHPEDREKAIAEMMSSIQHGTEYNTVKRFVTKNGAIRFINSRGLFVSDQQGKLEKLVGVFQDITEETEAQIHFQESKEKFESLVESLEGIFWEADASSFVFNFISPQVNKILGYTPEEWLSTPAFWQNKIHPEDKANAIGFCHRETIAGKNHVFEYRMFSASGEIVWLRDIVSVIMKDNIPHLLRGLMIDITLEKEVDKKLKDSEKQYKYLFKNNPAPMFIWDFETKNIIDCNDAATLKYKYTREEFLQLSIYDIRPPEDVTLIKAATISEDIYNNHSDSMHNDVWRHLTKEGDLMEVEVDGHVLMYQGRKSALVIIQDVTQKRKSERAIALSEEKYKTLFNSSPIPKWVYELDSFQIKDVNETAINHYGYSREDFLQLTIFDLRPKEEISKVIQAHEGINEKHGIIHFGIFVHQKKNGDLIRVEVTGYRFNYLDKDCIMALCSDVTEREILIQNLQNREAELIESNLRYSYVTKATNDAIWDYDVQNNILFWGSGFKSLFGYDPELIEVSFQFLMSCIHQDDLLRVSRKIETYMQDVNSLNWFEEYRFKKADGNFAYVMDRAVFLRNDKGIVIRVVGAMTDISYHKEYEESLRKLNGILDEKAKQLTDSNKELEQFAYVASHDLQEPLRMVTNFLTQIEKKYKAFLDEKGIQYIHFAVDGAQRMRQIILDLLEYSRVVRIEFKPENVDLNELLSEIQLLFVRKIEECNAIIQVEKLPIILGHKSPLRQVFQNLIDNALKYRNAHLQPKIIVAVKDQNTFWEFSVSDNGIGIEKEDFEKIFIIFQRLHSKVDYPGTGMGLAISKKIIDNFGGRIWLESTPGIGSKFYFAIPK